MQWIDIGRIAPNPFQPRTHIDQAGIEDLARDILARRETYPETLGLMQLPNVRRAAGDQLDRYEIVFGHRRIAAFRRLCELHQADYQRVPVEIVHLTDPEMAATAWAENAQRENLTAIEEAEFIGRLIEEFGWSQRQAAERLGLPLGSLSNTLRLLRLPQEAKDQIQQGIIGKGQAMELLRLPEYESPEALAIIADARRVRILDTRAQVDHYLGASSGGRRSEGALYAEVIQPATETLAQALADDDPGAWGLILAALVRKSDDMADDLDEVRRAVAEAIVTRSIGRATGRRDGRKQVNKLFDKAGLRAPWDSAAAARVDQFLTWRMHQAAPVGKNGRKAGTR